MDKNEGEWTGKIDFRKEEIPVSRRSIQGYILTYSRVSSGFSTDEFLISVSAVLHGETDWLTL